MAAAAVLAGVTLLLLTSADANAGQGFPSAAGAGATAAAKRCTRYQVGVARICLHVGQRCNPQLRHAYLRAKLECRGRRLRRASLAALRDGEPLLLDAHGRIDPRNALEAFNSEVAPLPGVRTRRGAVGRIDDPTEVIGAVAAQRRRLTRRQRAVLDRVLRPRPTGVSAETPADDQQFAGLVSEAAQRVRAHGFALNHRFALFFPTSNVLPGGSGDGDVLAYAAPGWLNQIPGYTDACVIYVTPLGVAQGMAERRRTIAHEMFHCAQFEFYNAATARQRVPLWVKEGSAEWAGDQIALEWNGSDIPDGHWGTWLDNPGLDLGEREYDAVGFWALLEQSGADVFARLRGVIPAAASGGDGSAYGVATAAVTDAFWNTWGPGFARKQFLGSNWDLTGPGIVPSTPPDHIVIGDGTDVGLFVAQRGANEQDFSFEADVIEIQSTASHGRLRTLAGENNLATETLCTRDGGCSPCPDSKPLNAIQVPKGIADLGYQGGGVSLTGESVDEACKKRGNAPSTPPPKTPACSLLARSGVMASVGGSFLAMGRACEGGRCLSRVQSPSDPEQSVCAYSRGAFLTLRRYGTARQARAFVQRYTRGPLHPVSIGADAASLATKASGTTVFMAVGRAAVTFSMSASSDTNRNPVWRNASATRRFAGRIARLLR